MHETVKTAQEKMSKCLAALERELTTVRAGRANPAVLDRIQVDYYGTPTAINAMAAISVSEARVLVIQPWDMSALKNIEKLSLLPISESLPQMTARYSVLHSLSPLRSAVRSL